MHLSSYRSLLIRFISERHIDASELLSDLRDSTVQGYLNLLARYALDARYTEIVFLSHEDLFVDVSSRWLESQSGSEIDMLAAYARLLPQAPYLATHLNQLLEENKDKYLHRYFSSNSKIDEILNLSTEEIQVLLIAVYRLMTFDNRQYASYVSPMHLTALLKHTAHHIRYLAVRILAQYLYASDSALEGLIEKHIGYRRTNAPWEAKSIDYTFFPFWESSREAELRGGLQRSRQLLQRVKCDHEESASSSFTSKDVAAGTAIFGSVLIPRSKHSRTSRSILIPTNITNQNLQKVAKAINHNRPLLVCGPSGSGKSAILREVAMGLGQFDSMIILHANEQLDTKLLLGSYTSSPSKGSFVWKPGILVTAVTQGRWVLVEDINHASVELLSLFKSLNERKSLAVPTQDQYFPCHPQFRLLGTVRTNDILESSFSKDSGLTLPVGNEAWDHVFMTAPSFEDLNTIVVERYPCVSSVLTPMKAVLDTVRSNVKHRHSIFARIGPMHLLRWCRRIQALLEADGIMRPSDPISQSTLSDIFVEAFDVLGSHVSQSAPKDYLLGLVAQAFEVPLEIAKQTTQYRNFPIAKSGVVSIGRARISISPIHSRRHTQQSEQIEDKFALTNFFVQNLEKIAVCVQMSEPCLLVGETGSGKTSSIQFLAEVCGHKLEVFNLSQETEIGDLFGGLKPVNPRNIIMPMRDEFGDLLVSLFPSRRNEAFLRTLDKAIVKSAWTRALRMWDEAIKSIDPLFHSEEGNTSNSSSEPKSKKRKLRGGKSALRTRWLKFIDEVELLRAQISNGDRGFAFHYVESRLVRAMRNGYWVLLDELNLAPSDVLDSLVDLFSRAEDESPSLFLPESGHSERVVAQRQFRVFGAMNPSTDVGKKDLAPNIRSRLTEIYFDNPDEDIENLVAIAKSHLGHLCETDVTLTNDLGMLHLAIKKLLIADNLVDGSGRRPHFSVRTFTRALIFTRDTHVFYGLRRASYEAFTMMFSSTLDSTSSLAVNKLIDFHILHKMKSKVALLRQKPRRPSDESQYVQYEHYWLMKGDQAIQQQAHYIITPFVRDNLLNLVRGTSTRRFPILLQGPTSSGKTSMVEYLANMTGNTFVRVNNHEHTDIQEYVGTYSSDSEGNLAFRDGVLVKALKEGHWIVLDELNLAPTDILEALNRLLDDNRELLVSETQECVRPHHNFMLFATQNPPGAYGGRKVLSRAFRNRFLELHFNDIPESELETILRERCQIAPSFCTRIVAVYKSLTVLRQSNRIFEQRHSFATLRDLFRWAFRRADTREYLAIHGFMLLAERVRDQAERKAVKKILEDSMKTTIDAAQIYSTSAPACQSAFQSSSVRARHVAWTSSMRRALVLVTEALKCNEPILLIGETGSGKTTICQIVAELAGRQLSIVNAHQNLETGDLIGTQRPLRNREMIEKALRDAVTTVLQTADHHSDRSDATIETLLSDYDKLGHSNKISLDVANNIRDLRARMQSLFEWVDGSLVSALKQGHYFLLDEISLAEDAVLERLNSVLEPNRSLFLAEKGAVDPLVVATEGFQFLATMNPGGDYGKRELSAALRNRFTEVWIPSICQKAELCEIVEFKLATEFKHLVEDLVEYAVWYTSEFETQSPYASIRDLLSWADFVNRNGQDGLSEAVVTGAASVYVDRLGANPTAKGNISRDDVAEQRQKCFEGLKHIFGGAFCGDFAMNSAELNHSGTVVTPGQDAANMNSESTPSYTTAAPTARANFRKILRALNFDKPILIEGNAGVGKTSLVAAVAEYSDKQLTRLNLSDQTDLVDLFGSDVPTENADLGRFAWVDAPFLQALREGHWILLDEMNLASQSILEGLNACFDHRGAVYIPELSQTFIKHPSFRVFATQNPHHQGGGRKGLPNSFVNRFTIVYADPLTDYDLAQICLSNHRLADRSIINHMIEFGGDYDTSLRQESIFDLEGGRSFNVRDVLRWLDLVGSGDPTDHYRSISTFVPMLFGQRMRTQKTCRIVAKIAAKRGIKSVKQGILIDREQSFLLVGQAQYQCSALRSETKYLHKRQISDPVLAESILLSVMHKWPVLLVGSSERTMTDMIRGLAAFTGAEVQHIPAYDGIDTNDLLGSYEQVDTQLAFDSFIRRFVLHLKEVFLESLLAQQNVDSLLAHSLVSDWSLSDANTLLSILEKLCDSYPESSFSDILTDFRRHFTGSLQTQGPKFAWVDGALVKAVKEGKWLILENVNFCDAAVLDRLNSVLEPGGSLLVNEHRTSSGTSENILPHPNARIFFTMDPSRGELSQAMRSRCVELFVSTSLDTAMAHLPKLSPAVQSSLSRLSILLTLDWGNIGQDILPDIMLACLNQLNPVDIASLDSFFEQCLHGLSAIPAKALEELGKALKVFHKVLEGKNSFLTRLQNLRNNALESRDTPFDRANLHTIHPHYWAALSNETSPAIKSVESNSLGFLFDVMIGLQNIEDNLTDAAGTSSHQMRRHLSALQSSNIGHEVQSKKFYNDPASRRFQIYQVIQALRRFINGLCAAPKIAIEGIEISVDMLFHLQQIVQASHLSNGSQGSMNTYLRLAKDALPTDMLEDFHPVLRDIHLDLMNHWHNLTSTDGLCSGLAMETIWNFFRPPLPVTEAQFQAVRRAQRMLEDFDVTKWNMNADPEDVMTQHRSLIRLVHHTRSPEWNPIQSDAVYLALQNLLTGVKPFFQQSQSHFHHEFDMLRQIESACSGSTTKLYHELKCLSEQTVEDTLDYVMDSDTPWSQLVGSIASLKGASPISELAIVRSQFAVTTSIQLEKASDVSLRDMARLEIDARLMVKYTTQMLKQLASDAFQRFYERTNAIMRAASKCLSDNSTDTATLDMFRGLSMLPASLNIETVYATKVLGTSTETFMQRALNGVLLKARQRSGVSQQERNVDPAGFAEELIIFFVGLLLLYVPNKSFDPADRNVCLQHNQSNRILALELKHQALLGLEAAMTRQETSNPIQLVEEQIRSVKATEQVSAVFRQSHCDVRSMQVDFGNILRVLTTSHLDDMFRETENEGLTTMISEIQVLERRITTNEFKVEDITLPLLAMLSGLEEALKMLWSTKIHVNEAKAIRQIAAVTPLMCCEAPAFPLFRQQLDERQTIHDLENKMFLIRAMSLARNVEAHLPGVALEPLFSAFHEIYGYWKQKLSRDQHNASTQTSLYRYKGLEADFDETIELEKTFSSENDSPTEQSKESLLNEPSRLAQKLAALYREAFGNKNVDSDNVLSVLRDASSRICNIWHDPEGTKKFPLKTDDFLPSLLLNLLDLHDGFTASATENKIPNFYKHGNVDEARRLLGVVRKTRFRFVDLRSAWPDHASIQAVIQLCDEILAMRHADPVAKFLVQVERLHLLVNDWQTVASSQYSAITCMEDLNDLIIKWRRLELRTWPTVLTTEDEQCLLDADSWWFMLYENIVAASLPSESGEAGRPEAIQKLLEVLRQFVLSSPIGQFEHRLCMIRCFHQQMKLIASKEKALTTISDAIDLFLGYHTFYRRSVREKIDTSRRKVEKDLSEVLLLASWKDTNIVALRESARRSHYKLLKIVHRYRSALSEPVEGLLASIPRRSDPTKPREVDSHPSRMIPCVDPAALELAKRQSWWHVKPFRHQDSLSTAERIASIVRVPSSVVEAFERLEAFSKHVLEDIRESQSMHGNFSQSQSENDSKHQVDRKRKLFLSTLKALRQMGFHASISQDVLGRQDSLAKIWSMIASNNICFETSSVVPAAAAAADDNEPFDTLLEAVSLVRLRINDHHQDLRKMELSRAAGTLETMLASLIQQKKLIATNTRALRKLQNQITIIETFWCLRSGLDKKQSHCDLREKAINRCLAWLPHAIDSVASFLGRLRNHSQYDIASILSSLSSQKSEVYVAATNIGDLPVLPVNVQNTNSRGTYAQAEALLDRICIWAEESGNKWPELAFLLQQVTIWTKLDGLLQQDPKSDGADPRLINLLDFDNRLSQTLDSMLIQVQRVKDDVSSFSAVGSEKTWFLHPLAFLGRLINNMQLANRCEEFASLMSDIQKLEDNEKLDTAAALLRSQLPILQAYYSCGTDMMKEYRKAHIILVKMTSELAQTFSKVQQNGFCSPESLNNSEGVSKETIEEGVGLGDGDGIEDISKDIEDDEDLSELAQDPSKNNRGDSPQANTDAVNMDADELEGELGSVPEDNDEASSSSSEANSEGDFDDELDKVDDALGSKVDEKLWDEAGKAPDESQQQDQTSGRNNKDAQEPDLSEQRRSNVDPDEGTESGDENGTDTEDDDPEPMTGVEQPEASYNEQHQDTEMLDLPEDMHLDNPSAHETDSGLEDEDLANVSEEEPFVDMDTDVGSSYSELENPSTSKEEDQHIESEPQAHADRPENQEHGNAAETEDYGKDDDHPTSANGSRTHANEQEIISELDFATAVGENQQSPNPDNANDSSSQKKIRQGGSSIPELQNEDAKTSQSEGRERGQEPGIDTSRQSLKQLGDALEEWHRMQRRIQPASDKLNAVDEIEADTNQTEVEHIDPDQERSNQQVLGAASEEQATSLNNEALASEWQNLGEDDSLDSVMRNADEIEEVQAKAKVDTGSSISTMRSALLVAGDALDNGDDAVQGKDANHEEKIQALDQELTTTHLFNSEETSRMTVEQANRLWAQYEKTTNTLSNQLTEELRLIMTPTQATRMRGDFRTGKRLNMKRIIPYIASDYKKDKIWMRRSLPSKRNYQIILAMDDSKSMQESGSGRLAFEALALITKSLTMLEAGQVCVLGFGTQVTVAHDFDTPVNHDSGAKMVRALQFTQPKTDVHGLLLKSIEKFAEARARATNSSADLWQLELIISDGICEDHEGIRRLLRRAQRERIMVIFVVVDSIHPERSIVDMSQATFEAKDGSEPELVIKRYLDDFPFAYYLIVTDIKDLPNVLAQALKQWFAEIQDSS